MILVNFSLCRLSGVGALAGGSCILNGPKPQGIHHRNWPRAHGENIAQNAANTGRRALERFDKGRMVMRLNLESACPSVANIDNAGIFSGSLNYKAAPCGQSFQVYARRFIRTMLAPHHAKNSQLCDGGFASA